MRFLCSWAQKKKTTQRRLWALVLLLSLQPVAALFSAPVAMAQAGVPSAVVINEFSVNGTSDWVELYNTTSLSVNVAGWIVRDSTTIHGTIPSGVISANGFLVIELGDAFMADTATIQLDDDVSTSINAVTYAPGGTPYPGLGQSTARVQNGGTQWVAGVPTKGTTNVLPDVLPPSIPGSGTPDGTLQPGQFTFTWQPSVDGQSAVQYQLRISQDVSQVGSQESSTASVYSHLTTPSLSAAAATMLTDGVWYWQVQAIDAANNKSAWSDVWTVEVDKTLPSVIIAQPSSGLFGGSQLGDIPFEAVVTDSHYGSLRVLLDSNDASGLLLEPVSNGVKVSATYNVKSLSDGSHTMTVIATDAAGNTAQATRTFEVDTTSPVLVTNIEDEAIVKGVVDVNLRATDNHLKTTSIDIFNSRGTSVKGEMLSSEVPESEVQSNPANLTYSWDTTTVADGLYTIRYSGQDEVGNEATMWRSVVVDNLVDTGFGGITTVDPLLEELSATLSQPFTVPQSLIIPQQRIAASAVPQDWNNAIVTEDGRISDIDIPAVAVAATESGWRILGVLWYWWVLIITLVALVVYRSWQTMKSYRVAVE